MSNERASASRFVYSCPSPRSNPISIFIDLTRRGLMAQTVRYLLFGEGETGLMVYTILLRYSERTPEDVRPLIFLMSD